MQLVAYGAQDIYLTGNPQITFFKVVYRRHTNFSMETIEQTINGSSAATGTGTVTISRNGDLVTKVYVTCADMTAGTDGTTLIDTVELEIGGQRIDKQTTQWNQIWADLTTPESKVDWKLEKVTNPSKFNQVKGVEPIVTVCVPASSSST